MAVGQVETVLKMVPIVEQIYIHADSNHEFTVVFIVPSTKHLEDLAESLGVSGELEDLCKDKKVESEVLKKLTESGIKGENLLINDYFFYMMKVRNQCSLVLKNCLCPSKSMSVNNLKIQMILFQVE